MAVVNFCPGCGVRIPRPVEACPSCGRRFAASPAPPESEPLPPAPPEAGSAAARSGIPRWFWMAAGVVAVGAVIGAVVVATGGSSEPADGDDGAVAPLDAGVLVVVAAIGDELGEEAGLLAVAYALDRGYDAAQMAEAASARTLRVDGTITGAEPRFPLAGVFADLPQPSALPGFAAVPASWSADGPIAPITSDQWASGVATEFEAILEGRPTPSAPSVTTRPPPQEVNWAGLATGVIASLADLGYSADQILLGIVAGEVRLDSVPTGMGPMGCWLLVAEDGAVVAPERSLVGGFGNTKFCREGLIDPSVAAAAGTSTTTTVAPATTAPAATAAPTTTTSTTEAPPVLPMTFAGPGTLTISFSFTAGSCTQDGQFLEVTLHPDGTATGVMDYVAPLFEGFLKKADGTYEMGECQGAGTESEVLLSGTHTPPAGGRRGEVFLDGQVYLAGSPIRILEGSYDAEDMTIEYRFDAFMEGFAESTGLPNPRSYGDYEFPLMVPVEQG